MRILFVSMNYAPEETGIAPYSTGVAEHFARHGHDVTVIAGMPHYPEWRVRDEYRGKLLAAERRNGVDVRRYAQFVPARQTARGRMLYEATSLAGSMLSMGLRRPDVVIGVVPALSGGVLARALATRFRVPYALVLQDLVGRAGAQSGMTMDKRVANAIRIAEGWAVRGAGALGVIADGFRQHVESLGVAPGRIMRLRNWTHVGPATIDRVDMRASLGVDRDAFLVLHAGNIGHKQGLENVADCARLAAASGAEIQFVLVGDGNQRETISALARRWRVPNLRLLPLQPPESFPSILHAADALLINQRPGLTDMSLPSKLTSYCAAGRPVIAAVDPGSETAREVTSSGCGIVTAAGDPAALLSGILRLSADAAHRESLAAAGMRYARETLSEATCLARYDALLDLTLGARRRRPQGNRAALPLTRVDDIGRERAA